MSKSAILALVSVFLPCVGFAKGGILNSSYEEVATMLGEPSRHDHGELSGVPYDRYHFETKGWKTTVLFIEGKAQKFDTEKSDSSALSAADQTAILEGYDLPDTGGNATVRGWRPLNETHFIRGDGRVHVIKSAASMTCFLDDLPREFW